MKQGSDEGVVFSFYVGNRVEYVGLRAPVLPRIGELLKVVAGGVEDDRRGDVSGHEGAGSRPMASGRYRPAEVSQQAAWLLRRGKCHGGYPKPTTRTFATAGTSTHGMTQIGAARRTTTMPTRARFRNASVSTSYRRGDEGNAGGGAWGAGVTEGSREVHRGFRLGPRDFDRCWCGHHRRWRRRSGACGVSGCRCREFDVKLVVDVDFVVEGV